MFHLAARSSSPMHQDNPTEGARVNVEGFIETVEAAIQEGAGKVVYASTSSMYGTVPPPHTEDADVVPKNRYSASKLCREQYGKCYSHRGEIQTTGLRFFSVYGPHEKPKGKYANIISQFLWKMQNGEQPVIWGDGAQERDFTYVEDVVDALIKAAETRQELDGEVVNVGTGQPHTFNEVMDALNSELETEIQAEFVENPRGDSYIHEHRADTSKAESLLGWKPSNSFQDGVRKTVDYHS
nr:MAG: nucleoside-diphosphate-sugar epimerase [Candidatus Nanosalinarum sp. J07AB56]